MKIPSRFKLFAETITVVEDASLLPAHNWSGAADYHKSEIQLVPPGPHHPVTDVSRQQVFCHELVHHIAYAIGLELSEKDTDLFGRALHQALTSMEYE